MYSAQTYNWALSVQLFKFLFFHFKEMFLKKNLVQIYIEVEKSAFDNCIPRAQFYTFESLYVVMRNFTD